MESGAAENRFTEVDDELAALLPTTFRTPARPCRQAPMEGVVKVMQAIKSTIETIASTIQTFFRINAVNGPPHPGIPYG